MINVIRKFVAASMAISLLLVSTVPTVTAAICDLPGISGMAEQVQAESLTPLVDWQDCYIECGCRIDNHTDGMPHQLAPHAFSMRSYDIAPTINHAIAMAEPVFTSRSIPFPTPPPRSI